MARRSECPSRSDLRPWSRPRRRSIMGPVRARHVVLIVLGSLGVLVGVGALIAGSVVTWAHATQRDDDGFFTTRSEHFETDTSAVSTDPDRLGSAGRRSDWRHDWGDLVTVRVQVDAAAGEPIFV